MASYKDWSEDIRASSTEQLNEYQAAIEVLQDWSIFNQSYEDLDLIKGMIFHELHRRG